MGYGSEFYEEQRTVDEMRASRSPKQVLSRSNPSDSAGNSDVLVVNFSWLGSLKAFLVFWVLASVVRWWQISTINEVLQDRLAELDYVGAEIQYEYGFWNILAGGFGGALLLSIILYVGVVVAHTHERKRGQV